MLDPELDAFLTSPVMMMVATRGADGRAALGRAMGARRGEGARLDIFISRAQWPPVVEALALGDPMAVTFSRPQDYRTYQVKGRLAALTPAGSDDLAFVQRYQHAIARVMSSIGVRPAFAARWMITIDVVMLSLDLDMVFVQTPGPGAGRPLTPAA